MSAIRALTNVDTYFTVTVAVDAAPISVKVGRSNATFGSGWTPSFAYVGFAPFIILELSNDTGKRAAWILDHGGERLGDKISDLTPKDRDLFRQCAEEVLSKIVAAGIADPYFAENIAAREYFAINSDFRSDLEKNFTGFQPTCPQSTQIEPITNVLASISPEKTISLTGKGIIESLNLDLRTQYLKACRCAVMTWQSPVDGELISEMRGLVLSPLLIAWRCVDRRHSLVFYIIASGFDQETAGIFIPAAQLFVSLPRIRFTQVAVESSVIVPAIVKHLLEYGETLQDYLSKAITRFATFTWPRGAAHMGHYIWNELSGLEQLAIDVESPSLPLLFDLGGAGGQEFFGPLELIFPELQPLISKRFWTIADMLRHAYDVGIQVFRFSARYVSGGLRTRLLNNVAVCPEAEIARQELFNSQGPVIVFGLRVENRTIVDLAEFYIGLARFLATEFGAITLIIDGHNSRQDAEGASTFESFLEHRATRPPIEVEMEIVARLKSALRGNPVHIINCIAKPMLANLAWLSQADYCVAPWGAGLAKARWVCNLPSYVLLSNFCRDNKKDIRIYSDSEFMQDPTPVQFVSRDLIRDRPDDQVLLKMNDIVSPYYVNYTADATCVGFDMAKALSTLMNSKGGWKRNLRGSV